jgi:hypothetical protein
MKPPLLVWAESYLKQRAVNRLPIAIHLKHNPAITGQSNANLDSWLTFMSWIQRDYPVHFFLVGDDNCYNKINSLNNISIVTNDGVTIDRSLALIQVAPLFMGMMSGPANMALFGERPYLIFKNPDHHAREMGLEIGDFDRYSFAHPNQRVLRMWDSVENLTNAFKTVVSQLDGLQCVQN